MANRKALSLRFWQFAFTRFRTPDNSYPSTVTGILFLIRWTLPIETTTLPTSRWSVDPGRFLLRPVLHVDSLHLRRDANQSSANQFHLRRFRK
jgi:hypothetical protein